MCDSHAWSRYTRIYPDRMVSVGSVAVKAKVIALYAVVLSNANHRRQNVRRGEANRRLRPDDAALKPDPPLVALSARLTASVYIYIYSDCEIPPRQTSFPISPRRRRNFSLRHEYGYEYG